MGKLRKLLGSGRVWIYIIFFILTMLAINPNPFNSGAAIRSVALNSSAYIAGMVPPAPSESPMSRERIVEINRMPVKDAEGFWDIVDSIPENTTITMKTQKSKFWLMQSSKTYALQFFSAERLGLRVYDAPKSNILLGLDLQGGTRVVLQPESKMSAEDMDILLKNMQERLNLFGLSDTMIRSANDLSGNQFIVVEIAGANEDEIKELLARQGKFEAKIGNETVFLGGKDITYVCRTASCSGIDPNFGCRADAAGAELCMFRFSISLSTEAAQRQAEVTKDLDVVYEDLNNGYLSQNIDLFLDDNLVDSLRIGTELRGNPVTDIQITGSGTGRTRQEAVANTQLNMKRLQTILITGSLPVKLDIIKTDTLSPSLGSEFLRNAVLIAILAEIAVVAIVVFRYRRAAIAAPIITIITSEILLILGVAALFKQNIDIAGIAGIIVAIGTGVDDQIVITDELVKQTRKDDEERFLSWGQRIKKAFFIVFASYFTTIASMIPLLFAGAGLLKGFAITTIIGVTNGVFITRPAFAKMMETLLDDEGEE